MKIKSIRKVLTIPTHNMVIYNPAKKVFFFKSFFSKFKVLTIFAISCGNLDHTFATVKK